MIPAKRAHLYVTAATHAGRKGKVNEDRYAVSAYNRGMEAPIPCLLAVVADGIGGHRAGEVAAELAIQTISQYVAQSDAAQPITILQQAIRLASQTIWEQSLSDRAKTGMGATCVCAWVVGDRLYTTSVGDSRMYLLRGGNLLQLTTDHTWVQEALIHGVLTPEQALKHPNRHVISRYLGSQSSSEPDFRLRMGPDENETQSIANQGMRLLPGDRLLLCSDGLTDLVKDEEIMPVLRRNPREKAVSQLVDLANERGGHDNITLITLEVPTSNAITQPVRPAVAPPKRLVIGCLAAVGLALAGILLTTGLFWLLLRGGGGGGYAPPPPPPLHSPW